MSRVGGVDSLYVFVLLTIILAATLILAMTSSFHPVVVLNLSPKPSTLNEVVREAFPSHAILRLSLHGCCSSGFGRGPAKEFGGPEPQTPQHHVMGLHFRSSGRARSL